MGLLDKLKNVFFEEEYVEVEEKEEEKPKKAEKVKKSSPKEEKIAKKIEVPKKEEKPSPKREEARSTRYEEKELEEALFGEEPHHETFSDRDVLQKEPAFRLFDDDDFMQEEKAMEKQPFTNAKSSSVKTSETRLAYGGESPIDYSTYKEIQKEKTFKPTPIISPIYGILDQNYSKDDIVDKNSHTVSSSYAKKVDLDTVREKAYGTLANDLGLSGNDNDEEEDKPPIITPQEESPIEDNLLYDLSDSSTPTVEKVTIADAEEYFEDLGLEYNIDYKDKSQESRESRKVKHIPDDEMDVAKAKHSKKEVEEPSESKSINEEEDNEATLEDNLFDLIDSMYEEKE